MSHDSPEALSTPAPETTALAEDILGQTIDVEKFAAVPEHSGNLQNLIERYGDNPGACPFIRSMGAAGIELVQKLAAAENNPERGPTMRELMEAKKKQAQLDKEVPEVVEKPEPAKLGHTLEKETPKTVPAVKIEAVKQSAPTVDKIINHEFAAKIVSEEHHPANSNIAEEIILTDNPVEHIKERRVAVESAPENEAQTVINFDPRMVIEMESITTNESITNNAVVEADVTGQAQAAATESKTAPATVLVETKTQADHEPVVMRQTIAEADAQGLPVESTIDNMGENDVETEAETEAKPPLEDAEMFDTADNMTDSDAISFIERTIFESQLESPPETDDETPVIAEITPDVPEPPSTETITTTDMSQESNANDISLVETPTNIELPGELNTYVETLEPTRATAVKATLGELVAIMQARPAESEAITGMKEDDTPVKIEQLFTQLLESLNLDHDEATTAKFLQILRSPTALEEFVEKQQLSIDQLNRLGTREYRTDSIVTIFTDLIQMIKNKIESHLHIGRCALSASLA